MDNLIKLTYKELKVGDEFIINKKNDKRVFRKESNGALQIKDAYGFPCADKDFRIYCYLDMPVWIERRIDMPDFDFSDNTKRLVDALKEIPESDYPDLLSGYQSPIQAIASQIEMTMEGETLKACQRVGVNVDKYELVKALQYDRQQYAKGFRAGYEKGLQVSQNEIDKFIGYLDEDMIARIKIAIEKRQGGLIP